MRKQSLALSDVAKSVRLLTIAMKIQPGLAVPER